jgi:hypothetical protein
MTHAVRVILGLVLVAGTGCPTVDLGETPVTPQPCRPDPGRFKNEVWPMAIAPADMTKSCVGQAGCHARETGRSALRLIAMPQSDADYDSNYDIVTRFLNCSTPQSSQFITKPASGSDPHAGGDVWTAGEGPALVVEQWIEGS